MALGSPGLSLCLLGDMEVQREGKALALPQSKKTRALLAYLVLTEKRHRRDRLCGLFWDVADDPRGALRWSLSKLRGLVDDDACMRIATDRDSIWFEDRGADIDVRHVVGALSHPSATLDIAQLRACAARFRGEFLEGLELPDFHEFQAWLVAQREDLRGLHRRALSTLIERLSDHPEDAVPYARKLVEIDPLAESSRAGLIRLLGALGRRQEAEQVYLSGARLGEELGSALSGQLQAAWRALPVVETRPPIASVAEPAAHEPTSQSGAIELIGRESELSRMFEALGSAGASAEAKAIVLTGAVGVGKSRLLKELVLEARGKGGVVLEGRAYEAESGRPYGPWIDALQRDATTREIFSRAEEGGTRAHLFGAVLEGLRTSAAEHPFVLVVIDDIQWLDESSAELLHFVLRSSQPGPLLAALSAREGELFDNSPALRMIRALRGAGRLIDIPVPPLDREQTARLAKALDNDADGERVFRESEGNPLFAIELARAARPGTPDLPSSLSELVRERVDRLPSDASDVLRWAAILGHGFDATTLAQLVRLDLDPLMAALELLERRALIQCDEVMTPGSGYVFSHDFVRHVVYSDISQPRRRLMHGRVAAMLEQADLTDEARASVVAHHAAMAGDARRAAEACVRAANQCLRVYASGEAHALSKRGMSYAAELEEPLRTRIQIELSVASYQARKPERFEEAQRDLQRLAELAVDYGELAHARMAFRVLGYLGWEGGDWASAYRQAKQGEATLRGGNDEQRVFAAAEAARCLLILERDLGEAEALVREAVALSERNGAEVAALTDAQGLLNIHRGDFDEARRCFERSRQQSRMDSDREAEFEALSHLVMLEIQSGCHAKAASLCHELERLAGRFREGSEAPFARALTAVTRYALEADDDGASIDEALEALRAVDAKHRLAFVLTRSALIDLERGACTKAANRAQEALRLAKILARPSEMMLSKAILVEVALVTKLDAAPLLTELASMPLIALSADVRTRVDDLLLRAGRGSAQAAR